MADDDVFLPQGRLSGVPFEVVIDGYGERVGDCLVYPASYAGKRVRLIEYWPKRVVWRDGSGAPVRADGITEGQWDDAVQRYHAKMVLLAASPVTGVVPVLEASVAGQGPRRTAYAVIEDPGQSLAGWLGIKGPRKSGPVTVRHVAAGIAETLLRLRSLSVDHLDLCPDTVFVGESVQLAFFATDNRPFMHAMPTQQGLVRPHYSPLERYDGKQRAPLGPHSDVYGASAVLYRMIEGRAPRDWWEDGTPATDSFDWGAYPEAFRAAVLKGLAIQPDDRFADIESWWRALVFPARTPGERPAFAPRPAPPELTLVTPTVPDAEEPSPVRTPTEVTGSRAMTIIALMIAAAAIVAIVMVYWANRPDESNMTVENMTPVESNVVVSTATTGPVVVNTVEETPAPSPSPSPSPIQSVAGRWRLESESDCSSPRAIVIEDGVLVMYWRGDPIREDIVSRNDDNTAVTAHSDALEQTYRFEVQASGERLVMTPQGEPSETWLRCPNPVRE